MIAEKSIGTKNLPMNPPILFNDLLDLIRIGCLYNLAPCHIPFSSTALSRLAQVHIHMNVGERAAHPAAGRALYQSEFGEH